MCVPKAIVLAPRRVRQEAAIHVVFQGGRGQLGEVVFRLVFVQQLGELRPAHALGIGSRPL